MAKVIWNSCCLKLQASKAGNSNLKKTKKKKKKKRKKHPRKNRDKTIKQLNFQIKKMNIQ
jgi:hypothetical protein